MADVKDFGVFSTVDGKFLMYKGLPLVREDNVICYGSMDEEYILQMIIMSMKETGGRNVPDKILIRIMKTDMTLPESSRIVKQEMKSGFYDAFELGLIWLDRYRSGRK